MTQRNISGDPSGAQMTHHTSWSTADLSSDWEKASDPDSVDVANDDEDEDVAYAMAWAMAGNDELSAPMTFYPPDWYGEPEPLSRPLAAPEFPLKALPPVLSHMADAASASYQAPLEMTGALVLSAVDIAMGGRYEVHLWQDWREPCQLYVVPVAEPGTRKTQLFKELVSGPISDAERQLKVLRGPEVRKSQAALSAVSEALKLAKKKYANNPTDVGLASVQDLEEKLAQTPRVVFPRLFTSDVTMQGLEMLQADHNGRMAIMSPESPLMANISGLYNGGRASFDPLLAGHASDKGQRTDRVSRDPVAIDHPSLSICLMAQPAVMDAMTGKAEFVGRGLVQRLLPVIADSMVGRRRTGPAVQGIQPEIRAAYCGLVEGLAVKTYLRAPGDRTVLKLSAGAREVFAALAAQIEGELLPEGRFGGYPLATEWGSKFVGTTARIAAILHLASGVPGDDITEVCASAAAAIGEFFAGHALAAFSRTTSNELTYGTRYLLERIKQSELKEEFAAGQLAKLCGRTIYSTAGALLPYLDELESLGWIREGHRRDRPAGDRSRRPVRTYRAWPGIWDDSQTDATNARPQ